VKPGTMMESRPWQQDMSTSLRANDAQARQMGSGFEVWASAPPPDSSNYMILGSEFSQILEVNLQPGELITAEPRTMLYMSSGMNLEADMGGVGQGLKRGCCAGESMFRLHLCNNTDNVEKVAVTPTFPAKVVPIDLGEHDGMVFNRGAFLAAIGKDWKVDIKRVQGGLGVCCCAGQGLFLNTLHGNGMVFLNAGGSVLTKVLAPGEEIVVDKHAVLAFERTVTIGIRRTGGLMVCCCAGQGLFNTVLTGPGFIMVHSMALSRLRSAIAMPGQGGGGNAGGANAGGGA